MKKMLALLSVFAVSGVSQAQVISRVGNVNLAAEGYDDYKVELSVEVNQSGDTFSKQTSSYRGNAPEREVYYCETSAKAIAEKTVKVRLISSKGAVVGEQVVSPSLEYVNAAEIKKGAACVSSLAAEDTTSFMHVGYGIGFDIVSRDGQKSQLAIGIWFGGQLEFTSSYTDIGYNGYQFKAQVDPASINQFRVYLNHESRGERVWIDPATPPTAQDQPACDLPCDC